MNYLYQSPSSDLFAFLCSAPKIEKQPPNPSGSVPLLKVSTAVSATGEKASAALGGICSFHCVLELSRLNSV